MYDFFFYFIFYTATEDDNLKKKKKIFDAREIIMWVYVMTSIVNLFCRSAVQA